jgi:TPR repeat protein
MNIKEIEPTIRYIHTDIFEEDFSFVIHELVDFISKELNEGKEEIIRKQRVLNYVNNQKIILKEVYHWLLNNQNDSTSIYLLGYFNYHGIESNIDKQKAFKLYQKAAELKNNLAQFDLALMYEDGEGVEKNYDKTFELSKDLTERKFSSGINLLGYCYYNGIGTEVNKQKAFELYNKAAYLGNNRAQCNLALMYKNENFLKDDNKVFELSKKCSVGKHSGGINLLGYCYDNGIGTDIDTQKAFELYQEAANLGNKVAQHNLANMYEYGEGVEKNTNKAIYWYKKSAEQGYQNALNVLNNF